jgi:DpnII restriction endonuclease
MSWLIRFRAHRFAIPSKDDATILLEVKAYGATGSKQTDVLGDVHRIMEEKRHDTKFLLVTDGPTSKSRLADLRKFIELQNHGKIMYINTQKMAADLESDLTRLRKEHGLGRQ